MDFSREYLHRHNIHRLFENCVEDLVTQQPKENSEVAKTIIRRLESTKNATADKRIFFVVGSGAREYVDGAADSETTVIAANNKSAEDIRSEINASFKKTIFVVDFPKGIADAVQLEAKNVNAALLLHFTDYKDVKPGTKEYDTFIKTLNPVLEYYRTLGRLATINVNDKSVPPLEQLRNAIS